MTALMPDRIAALISQDGPIPVEQFMMLVLTDPEDGYYTQSDPIGARGDFITAPEISQMFGELIGLWAVDSWQRQGSPGRFHLVELGPGHGTLMADALRAAQIVPAFGEALNLHLVEASPTLRERQIETIGLPLIHHDTIASLPGDAPLIVVANEFFDALPVRQFQHTPKGWMERMVDLDRALGSLGLPQPSRRFRFVLAPEPVADPVATLGERIRHAPMGAIAELARAAEAIMEELATRIAAQGGAGLFIDYGAAQSGLGDTLQAVRKHKRHDVLDEPGTADLTVHVDFERLGAVARACGVLSFPAIDQGSFLTTLGIDSRANRLMREASAKQAEAIAAGRHRLVDPEQMGTLFKAFGIAHADIGSLAGLPMPEEN